MSNLIEVNNVSKVFLNGKRVLRDVSFSLGYHERLAICGENGAGKTTLLRILGNLTIPTNGYISIENLSNSLAQRKGKIGWVPTGEAGFFHRLNGYQNLRLFSTLMKVKRVKFESEIINWTESSPAFKEALKTPFYICSSGMKYLLSMFRATVHQPKLLLLDEPNRALDKNNIQFIQSIFDRLGPTCAIVFSSHDNFQIQTLKAKQLTLKEGLIV